MAVLALFAGLATGLAFARYRVRSRIARHRLLGHRGEEQARRLLRKAGYRIEAEQVSGCVRVRVDGRCQEFVVRADAMVRRRRRRYVVEIKAGQKNATVADRATRRQLLEYTRVFDVDGALLVDVPAKRISRIEFD